MASLGELRRRAQKLLSAAAARAQAGRVGGVLRLLAGETVDDGLARAAAAGRSGSVIVAPAELSIEDWEREAVEHQRVLAAQMESFTTTGRLPT